MPDEAGLGEGVRDRGALRITASRRAKQPKLRPFERGLMVALSSMVRNWQNAVLLVKPDTVLRWHREGFRLLWKRKSKPTEKVIAFPS